MLVFLKYLRLSFELVRCLPHIIFFYVSANYDVIRQDNRRWLQIMDRKESGIIGLIYLLGFFPEYRNLFYKRIGTIGHVLNIICPKMSSLFIATENIGPGLFIQHGFATIIAAESIGKNCWINQQVTIGFGAKNGRPVIKDNVRIAAGAKVFNDIIIGESANIGANAVVTKNVPAKATVIGIPAYIIKIDGIKITKSL